MSKMKKKKKKETMDKVRKGMPNTREIIKDKKQNYRITSIILAAIY